MKVRERGREFVAADGSTLVTKPSFDAVIVKDGWSDGRLSNPASTGQSNWGETFCESEDLLYQHVASREDPRLWRRQFPWYTGFPSSRDR